LVTYAMGLRDAYDLPDRLPVACRQWLVSPALALGLWLLLPDSPVAVAVPAIAVMAAVFVARGPRAARSRARRARDPTAERHAAPVLSLRSSPGRRRSIALACPPRGFIAA
jgi:hypothetical protein